MSVIRLPHWSVRTRPPLSVMSDVWWGQREPPASCYWDRTLLHSVSCTKCGQACYSQWQYKCQSHHGKQFHRRADRNMTWATPSWKCRAEMSKDDVPHPRRHDWNWNKCTWTPAGIMTGIKHSSSSEWNFFPNVTYQIRIFRMTCWHEAVYSDYLSPCKRSYCQRFQF